MKNFNPLAFVAAAVMLLACMLAVCSSAKAGCGGQLQVQQFVQPYAAQQVFVQPFVLQQHAIPVQQFQVQHVQQVQAVRVQKLRVQPQRQVQRQRIITRSR